MIKTVIFDLDDTLYGFWDLSLEAMDKMVKRAEELTGIPAAEFRPVYEDSFRSIMDELDPGKLMGTGHSRTLRLQHTLEHFGRSPFPAVLELYDVYWDYMLDNMKREPHIEETMQAIKARGLAIGIGTNMTAHIQYRKIERLGLGKYIDFMVTSDEAVYDKPDPRFFRLAVKKAGCLPEECLFVGDNKAFDYEGPLACGLKARWYNVNGAAQNPGDKAIHDHLELLQAIDEENAASH